MVIYQLSHWMIVKYQNLSEIMNIFYCIKMWDVIAINDSLKKN